MSSPTKPTSNANTFPTGFGRLAADLLNELITEFRDQDVGQLRTERLAELSPEDRQAWDRTYTALDRLIVALRHREGAIRLGEVASPTEADAPEEMAPVEVAPVEVAPVEVAPVEVAPVEVAPVEVAPVEVAPVEVPDEVPLQSAQVEAAPADLAAAESPMTSEPPPAVATPLDELDFHDRQTIMLPSVTEADLIEVTPAAPPKLPAKATMPSVPAVAEASRGASWSRSAELLFEDALRLFRMGDSDGGLVSLERLLVTTELVDDLKSFVDVNQDRVLELYESVMAPWNRIPERLDPSQAPHLAPFLEQPKVAFVLSRLTGRDNARTIALSCESAGMRRLEVAAVLSQLVRARVIRLRDTA